LNLITHTLLLDRISGSREYFVSLTILSFSDSESPFDLSLKVCRALKSLGPDSKEITKATVFVQPVTLSALSLSEPLPTINRKTTKG
jgi:hypothetical protein